MKPYVFITGATAGFGKACAELFAKEQFNLIITGRRGERLEQLKEDLESQFHIHVVCLVFDVRNESQVNEVIGNLTDEVKNNVTVLINNAGLAVGRGSIDNGLTDDWDRMIDTNVKGLLYVSKAVIPLLKRHESSHIVNIASIAGKEVYPGGNVYCASKHAVDALSKAMRIDLLPFGTKVTNIAPGAANTEFSLVRFKGDQETADSIYQGFDPLLAEDIADAVWFAVSRPAHVNINDLVIMPSTQANTFVTKKS